MKSPISIFQGSFQSWDWDFCNQSFLRFLFIEFWVLDYAYAPLISKSPKEKSQRVQIDVNEFLVS